MNLIKGDTVMVRRGKERGKRGVVKAVFPHDGTATVERLNIVKRHTKQKSEQSKAGIFDKEAPLPLSALMYVCTECGVPGRLRTRNADGGRQRICGRCGAAAAVSVKGR